MRFRHRLSGLAVVLALVVVVTVLNVRLKFHENVYLDKLMALYSPLEDGDNIAFKPVVGQNIDNDPRHKYWESIFNIFGSGSVNFTKTEKEAAVQYIEKLLQKDGPNTKSVLLSKGFVAPDIVKEMGKKHALVASSLPKKLDTTTYTPGSSGIVMVGGSKFSWLLYLSLLSLRRVGSTTPVEIVMPQHDDFVREARFCKEVLPKLNARCVVLPEVLGANVMNKWKMANYQLKSLALMVSSFQNVLLLDSDNVLVQNPDVLFSSDVFLDHGMVLWPDYWERTISPIYYEVANLKVDEAKRVRAGRFPLAGYIPADDDTPYHDLAGTIPNLSTESGQLLINKKTHACTLLLAMYYNMLGPDLYYKLFSLGEMGEGDKDTFPAAASACGEKFYQVRSFIRTFGYVEDGGGFQGVAMGQKDPIEDYANFKKYLQKPFNSKEMRQLPLPDQIKKLGEIQAAHFDLQRGKLFAIHCNYPKLDPIDLMAREGIYNPEENKLRYRLFSGLTYDDPRIKDKSIDFEYEQWHSMETTLCENEVYFVHFSQHNLDNLCMFIRNQVKFLKEAH